MNPKYVTSLELSRTLQKLGVPQDSEFYWVKKKNEWKLVYIGGKKKGLAFALIKVAGISAFLSGELGEMLPDDYFAYKKKNLFYIANFNDKAKKAKDLLKVYYCDDFEAEARGKMLAYLKENKLI